MQDFDELKKLKAQCISDIRDALPFYANRLNECDERLMIYIEDAISNNASHANLYELLGIRKELRLMSSYDLDPQRVKRSLRAIEGQWANGRHVKGGLRFSTPRGSQHVRLMPFQVWLIFEIYAFKVDVPMERTYHEGDQLLPTEWVRDGEVWDTRRLTQEAHWFVTRKSGKTELGAAVDFVEACFLGDVNGQVLICAPSAELSKISFKAVRNFAMQIDPTCTNRMGGKYFRMTKNELSWQPGQTMKGEIKTMAAGKVPKDGYYASVVHADEHGQPSYVNGHCDMQASVDTCWGSTGPRREKLLMHTTTAGRVKDGPYKSKIENDVEPSLLREMQYPLGQPHRTPDDYWCAFLLQLDKWELTDDLTKLDDPELFKKVNRSIGTTVQPTYYRERLHEAVTGTEDTKQEVLTKDFNMWQGVNIMEWIKPDRIREMQRELRVDDCTADKGWVAFGGLDFSMGDDLWAHTYLCINLHTGEFFADCDAWITQKTLEEVSIRPLYEKWIDDGWLRVCPGEVIEPSIPIRRIMDLAGWDSENMKIVRTGVNFMRFGYDQYKSPDPINLLKAWMYELGANPVQHIVPVPQTNAAFNQPVEQINFFVKASRSPLSFSMSPLWPYCFGCCVLDKDTRMENKKPIKRNSTDACKVDPVQALCDAFVVYNQVESSEHPAE